MPHNEVGARKGAKQCPRKYVRKGLMARGMVGKQWWIHSVNGTAQGQCGTHMGSQGGGGTLKIESHGSSSGRDQIPAWIQNDLGIVMPMPLSPPRHHSPPHRPQACPAGREQAGNK